jgi:Tfp pilus assembly protein PilX
MFQRGIILFITLMILISMALASVALMRSVDTTVLAVSNWSFRQAAQAPAFWAVDESLVFLEIAVTDTDAPSQGYYASFQGSNSVGIPLLLTQQSPTDVRILNDSSGNTLYYLIERMCLHDGSPDASHCLSGMLPGETIVGLKKGELPTVLYRITVRVDGPRHATVYMQTVVRHVEPPFVGVLENKRLSTRFIEL